MIYCPYTDRELDASETTAEHIIPLSLGGCNAFTIPVERQFNSEVGHAIDGKFATDGLITVLRARKDARGHSGQPPRARWRTVDEDGNPLQTVVDAAGFNVYDPKARRTLARDETAGRQFSARFEIQQFVRVPFAAKVALGTGQFLFGDAFRRHVQHQQLRDLLTPLREIPQDKLRANRVSYLDRINDRKDDRADPHHRMIELMCASLDASTVVVVLGNGRLWFSIAILGEWQATLGVEAEDKAFPDTGEHDLGHVIALQGGQLVQLSMREAAAELHQVMNRSAPSKSSE